MTTISLPPREWSTPELVALCSSRLRPADALEQTRTHPSLSAAIAAGLEVPMSPSHANDLAGHGFALSIDSDRYPSALKDAPNPPAFLFGIGEPFVLSGPALGVSGTRTPSPLGLSVSEVVASAAAHARVPVVNGGAAGCDARATQAAFQYETPVITVTATGPDLHTATAAVTAAGGVVVSEHPFGRGTDTAEGIAPYTSRLMARNRIIVGLSSVLVPASGTLRSGTAGAVWMAFAAGRPVLVARPRPSGWALPDAELALALAHEPGPNAGQLRAAGCSRALAEKLAGRTPLAGAVADSPDELSLMAGVLLALSPGTTTPDRKLAAASSVPV